MRCSFRHVRLGKVGAAAATLLAVLGCRPDLSAQNSGGPAAAEPPAAAAPAPGTLATCRVERIVDGDTFVCAPAAPGAPRERVRLLLIDTPELAQRPFGEAARDTARALLPEGTSVRLDFDVSTRDPFERLLAYVWVGERMVNREMVRRGMAVVAVYPPDVREVDMLRAASDSARAERRGLWSVDAFACKPRDYRAGRCR